MMPLNRKPALGNFWSALRRQEWAIGMPSSVRARLNSNLCHHPRFRAIRNRRGNGSGVSGFKVGDEVYGATKEQFSGAYAEYALALARMIAQKPKTLNFIEAASAPVVTVTAWQMLFDYAEVTAGQPVLIHGAAGNVGAYAVQLACQAGLHVIATAASADLEYVRGLGAERILDFRRERFEDS